MAKEPTKPKATKEEITLYCGNKSLTICHLGVQFRDGKFITTDRKLADTVLKYADVFEM